MQVNIIRRTGMPVQLSDMENYMTEFRALFDKAEKILKREAEKIGNKQPDMLKMQGRIAKIQNALVKKYPTVQEVALPATAEEWLALQTTYGNILVSRMMDKDEVVLVIEDQETFQY